MYLKKSNTIWHQNNEVTENIEYGIQNTGDMDYFRSSVETLGGTVGFKGLLDRSLRLGGRGVIIFLTPISSSINVLFCRV